MWEKQEENSRIKPYTGFPIGERAAYLEKVMKILSCINGSIVELLTYEVFSLQLFISIE